LFVCLFVFSFLFFALGEVDLLVSQVHLAKFICSLCLLFFVKYGVLFVAYWYILNGGRSQGTKLLLVIDCDPLQGLMHMNLSCDAAELLV
jgi:hypothetical protein